MALTDIKYPVMFLQIKFVTKKIRLHQQHPNFTREKKTVESAAKHRNKKSSSSIKRGTHFFQNTPRPPTNQPPALRWNFKQTDFFFLFFYSLLLLILLILLSFYSSWENNSDFFLIDNETIDPFLIYICTFEHISNNFIIFIEVDRLLVHSSSTTPFEDTNQ